MNTRTDQFGNSVFMDSGLRRNDAESYSCSAPATLPAKSSKSLASRKSL